MKLAVTSRDVAQMFGCTVAQALYMLEDLTPVARFGTGRGGTKYYALRDVLKRDDIPPPPTADELKRLYLHTDNKRVRRRLMWENTAAWLNSSDKARIKAHKKRTRSKLPTKGPLGAMHPHFVYVDGKWYDPLKLPQELAELPARRNGRSIYMTKTDKQERGITDFIAGRLVT